MFVPAVLVHYFSILIPDGQQLRRTTLWGTAKNLILGCSVTGWGTLKPTSPDCSSFIEGI